MNNHIRTGMLDRNGNEIFAGDRILIDLTSENTKKEYWRPEYVVIWKAPKFSLEWVGGDKDSSTARWYFALGERQGLDYIEILERTHSLTPTSHAGRRASNALIDLHDLMDILAALPQDEVLVPANSDYNVGASDWTGRMIYDAAAAIARQITDGTSVEPPMTDAEIRMWASVCNSEAARQVLHDYVRLRNSSMMELDDFDAAVAVELSRVSHAEYDSHEVCKHFAGALRKRLTQQPAAEDMEDLRRLKWLVTNELIVRRLSDSGQWMVVTGDQHPAVDGGEYDTWRKAIDEAIAAQQGGRDDE